MPGWGNKLMTLIDTTRVIEKKSNFRTDIIGLRGVAVIAVMLHHFEIPGFIGAFYGPDIFFVLSGYLITGSLVKEYSRSLARNAGKGSISIMALYARRIRRIFPASIFVIIAVNIYALLFVNELRASQIRTDSIWTLLFGANIRFLQTSTDYFSTGAISPFVHFWSLSVTEQFYLVWPFLILCAAKFGAKSGKRRIFTWQQQVLIAFGIVIVTSFIWSIVVFRTSHNDAYFSTFCRAWELAVGGAIAVLNADRLATRLGDSLPPLRSIAIIFLFGSLIFISPDNFGYTLFVPTLAAALLIFTGSSFNSDISYRILGSKFLVAVGTISYSMYLWHWPIFVFGRNLGLMNTIVSKGLGIALTTLFAVLTYWAIERPFMKIAIPSFEKRTRKSPKNMKHKIFLYGGFSFVVALVGALSLNSSLGSQIRWNSQSNGSSATMGKAFNFSTNYGVENFQPASSDWQLKIRQGAALKALPATLVTPLNMLDNRDVWRSHGFDCITMREDQSDSCAKGSSSTNQNPSAPKVVILGGSYAEALTPAIFVAFNPKKYNIRGFAMDQCAVADVNSLFSGKDYSECQAHRAWSFEQVAKLRPDYVVISANGRNQFKEPRSQFGPSLLRSLNRLSKSGAKLILVSTKPPTGKLSSCLKGKSEFGPECSRPTSNGKQLREVEREATTSAGGTFIDSTAWTCTKTVCPPIINNMIVTWEGSHLTPWFSKAIGTLLKDELQNRRVLK